MSGIPPGAGDPGSLGFANFNLGVNAEQYDAALARALARAEATSGAIDRALAGGGGRQVQAIEAAVREAEPAMEKAAASTAVLTTNLSKMDAASLSAQRALIALNRSLAAQGEVGGFEGVRQAAEGVEEVLAKLGGGDAGGALAGLRAIKAELRSTLREVNQDAAELREGLLGAGVSEEAILAAIQAKGGDAFRGVGMEFAGVGQGDEATRLRSLAAEQSRLTGAIQATERAERQLTATTVEGAAGRRTATAEEIAAREAAASARALERAEAEAVRTLRTMDLRDEKIFRAEQAAGARAAREAEQAANAERRVTLQLFQTLAQQSGQGRVAGLTGRANELGAGLGALGVDAEAVGATSVALVAGAAAVAALAAAVGAAIIVGAEFDAQLEREQIRLENLTFSIGTASDFLKGLQQASTGPTLGGFDFADLEKGVELLARLNINTQAWRETVADTAAGTGKGFNETAVAIGHVVDIIQSGLPNLGRAVLPLERAGIITGAYAEKLRVMNREHASTTQQLEVLQEALSRYNGEGEKLGNTFPAVLHEIGNQFKILAGIAVSPFFDRFERGAVIVRDELRAMSEALEAGDIGKALEVVGLQFELFANKLALTFVEAVEEVEKFDRFVRDKLANVPVVGGIANAFVGGVDEGTKGLDAALQRRGQELQGRLAGLTKQAELGGQKFGEGFVAGIGATATTAEIFGAGQDFLDQFFAGASAEQQRAFDDLDKQLTARLTALGGGKLDILGTEQLLKAEPILVQLVKDVEDYGGVTEVTAARAREALGNNADSVLQLAEAYAQLSRATRLVDYYQQQVDAAQRTEAADREESVGAIKAQEDALKGLQQQAQATARDFEQQEQGLKDKLDGVQAAAAAAATGYDATIKGLRGTLEGMQAAAEQRRADLDAELAAAQEAATATQNAAKQHQEAFQAVTKGTIDLFLQENDAIDETTAKIVQMWDAQIGGARRARDAAAEHAEGASAAQRARLLGFDEAIDRARTAGNLGEIARLQQGRAQYERQSSRQVNLERERATVAQDNLNKQSQGLDRAAAQQGIADDKATRAAKARVDEIEDRRKRQADADKEAQAAIEAEIKGVEAEKQASADYYKGIESDISASIKSVERAKQAQADADKQRIDDQQTLLDNTRTYWSSRLAADKKAVDDAEGLLKDAKDTVSHYKDQITALDQIGERMDKRFKDELAYYNLLRAERDLPPLTYEQAHAVASFEVPKTATSPVEGNVPETRAAPAPPPPSVPDVPPPPGDTFPDPSQGGPGGFRLPYVQRASASARAGMQVGMVYNQNAPLAGTLHVREEADIAKVSKLLAGDVYDAWQQNRRAGQTTGVREL